MCAHLILSRTKDERTLAVLCHVLVIYGTSIRESLQGFLCSSFGELFVAVKSNVGGIVRTILCVHVLEADILNLLFRELFLFRLRRHD